ncbi:MAG: response regulator [Terriglobales bacterium]|jgi:DNA-binding NarL/FixJ family response regulator
MITRGYVSGVAALLSSEPKWQVCGEAPDGTEALKKAQQLQPDLILLDISRPGIGGLEVARHCGENCRMRRSSL